MDRSGILHQAAESNLRLLRGMARDDLLDAQEKAWDWIARPGTWMTGVQRCEVVREVRLAQDCALCRARKEALSPASVEGVHASNGILTPAHVEAIHKLATDPGRLSKGWLDGLVAEGLDDGVYVETAGIVAIVMTMDTFTWSMGFAPTEIPEPVAGEPTRYRPPGAKINDCWLPTIAAGDRVESDGPLYGVRASGVHRALSLVPATKIAVFDLQMAHYIDGDLVGDTSRTDVGRAITRPQIEILASRVSVLNQCLF